MSGNSFSGNDSDFVESFRAIAYGAGTYQAKRLPAAKQAPAIPDRAGSAGHETVATSSSGGVDMTLKGAKTVTSTDGLITIVYPQTAEVIVGATIITIPAIKKTP